MLFRRFQAPGEPTLKEPGQSCPVKARICSSVIPELRANTNVKLGGLGKLFNTTFYVHQTTHTIDTSGYRTTFEVKDTTI